jgi:hypothetical protein
VRKIAEQGSVGRRLAIWWHLTPEGYCQSLEIIAQLQVTFIKVDLSGDLLTINFD